MGLTAKQQRAIAICAGEVTNSDGVKKCIEQRVCSDSTFYERWMKQAMFVQALNDAREKSLGDVAERCRNRCIAEADGLTAEAIEIAYGRKKATAVQLDAIQYVLDKAGVDNAGKAQRKNLLALIGIRIEQGAPSENMEVSVVTVGDKSGR